ncbi:DUF6299 family protein [Streptomyces sp. NRRL S-87]|uniref:DUF6299 family protein n=1 Tax=Streptomyces sp. NRRL S-87 TaxID=1463920 RepID=UPI0004C0EDE1|nr:DUF6299 family protein [Streptomyces sp. NRRL S-87]
MRISKLALLSLAALATLTVPFTSPATAAAFSGEISVRDQVHIAQDGTVTLSGTYRCSGASPLRGVFVSSSLVQDGTQLGFGGTDAVCDGAEHAWESSGPVNPLGDVDLGFHGGPAQVDAHLMTLESSGGWLPLPHALAGGRESVDLVDHRAH